MLYRLSYPGLASLPIPNGPARSTQPIVFDQAPGPDHGRLIRRAAQDSLADALGHPLPLASIRMDPTMASRIDALEQTWTSLQSVLKDLNSREWHLPTGCPGWDVQDNVAHISGLERWIMGEPLPDHVLPAHLPHVRDDNGRLIELSIDYRRAWSPRQVYAEFVEIVPGRLATLRADDTEADAIRKGPFGAEMPYKALMTIRIFDCFAHEQDVRRATGRHGNLTGPAAALSRRLVVNRWTRIVADLPELDKTRVVLELDGEPHPLIGPATEDEPAAEQLLLRMSFENALALACGRSDAEPSQVTVIGDRSRFVAMVPRLGFTP